MNAQKLSKRLRELGWTITPAEHRGADGIRVHTSGLRGDSSSVRVVVTYTGLPTRERNHSDEIDRDLSGLGYVVERNAQTASILYVSDPVSALSLTAAAKRELLALLMMGPVADGERLSSSVARQLRELGLIDDASRLVVERARELGLPLASRIDDERPPAVHTFETSGQAYNASQTSEGIVHGDVLSVPDQSIVGILDHAWPLAVTADSGEFHTLNSGELVETLMNEGSTADDSPIDTTRRAQGLRAAVRQALAFGYVVRDEFQSIVRELDDAARTYSTSSTLSNSRTIDELLDELTVRQYEQALRGELNDTLTGLELARLRAHRDAH